MVRKRLNWSLWRKPWLTKQGRLRGKSGASWGEIGIGWEEDGGCKMKVARKLRERENEGRGK